MKPKRPALKTDMFVKSRRKLTYTYTWLIILFLVVFSMIVSAIFLGMAYREQQESIMSTLFATTEKGNVAIPDLSNSRGDDLYFFYVLDDQGNVLAGSSAYPQLDNMNIQKIIRWHPRDVSFRLDWQPETHVEVRQRVDIEIEPKLTPKAPRVLMAGERLLYVGARPVMLDNGTIAVIYAAKDVTFYYEVFRNLLVVFLLILVVFIMAAVWLSNSMSKKAMIPIQQAYRQQQQFLADASHELRTPLSIMNTSLDVIELENGQDFSAFTKEVVVDMKEEVGRMSRMVQHLLLLARSDAGSVEFEKASFDLVPKVRQWVQTIDAVAHKKQISLKAELPEQLAVTGDVERIKQLVYILLDNAIKYTPEGGTVDVALSSSPKQWSLSIRDTGMGIPEHAIPRIFDRFYRVEEHRSREEGSAGLGLSIAKWIAESHQGSIEVKSALGEGSTFIVRFPLV
ncbi:cell wall metabolism sensor histidine kinase WalK [Paenibacillus sp. BC26]|uniref:sensor histidine kinase n=1 Tax=Paenibacillus sp. BC26 TaxID=1881032 RepID=UPI0008E48A5A|nr:HAMP domain-containing histidine kinase [Paenibacillus sp. BC26]SFS54318.1 His Kinase A (phospho-acceptor) domain-containing protein [Paenibacillus sp. BC26]